MIEPEVQDLQLTVDTLKTQIRDGQRVMAELRTELESRRQELADAQVAKAQLEGRVREAERRVAEARHVINLQREELAAARTERERISKSSAQLQSHMKKLQKHIPKAEGMEQGDFSIAPASTGAVTMKGPRATAVPMGTDPEPLVSASMERAMASPAAMITPQPPVSASTASGSQGNQVRTVSVKPGDTLWGIAHRYQVDLQQLRALNRLTDNNISVGQALWVPAAQSGGGQKGESAP
jgi:LysM repeat protein